MPNWLLPLIFAPLIGSFAGVLVRRLPHGEYAAISRSHRCGVGTPPEHLAVGLACLSIAAVVVAIEPDALQVELDCALGWTLLTLAWIDWRHMLLPDVLTLPLIIAGMAATALQAPETITEHAAATAAGYLAFRAVAFAYRRLRGHEGLGHGDAKLMAAAGAWLGLGPLADIVFAAAMIGLAVAAGLRIAGHAPQRGSALPFGPELCIAIWVAQLCPDASLLPDLLR